MSVEVEEVRHLLDTVEPFCHLPGDVLDDIAHHMTLSYVRRGTTIIAVGNPNDELYMIRSGAVDIVDDSGVLLDRRDQGRCFGYSTIMGENISRYDMVAVEDTLLIALARPHVEKLVGAHADVARYFSSQSARMRAAATQLRQEPGSDVLRTRLGEFMIPEPAHVHPEMTIQQAARTMQERNVSSLLVVDSGELHGIVTDRDMRGRVVADNMDVTLPVTAIMTARPRTATPDTLAFEAMLTMAELGIHHLPVVDEGRLVGIVASADIMRLLQHDPIYLTADLSRRSTPEELAAVYSSAGQVAARFVERGTSAEDVTGLLTVAADALAKRMIHLAEDELGPAPVPYAFVVLGSQGRRGMGLASDQDNALILDDSFDAAAHGDYFSELSRRVCTGLDHAGQVLCPGDMMASNPAWRMTVTQWHQHFHQWITAPEPDALLAAQVFFDMRPIAGTVSLGEAVHHAAVAQAHTAPRFHAHLAALAARREPPLGFFRGLVVERSGDYAHTLDVKKGGIAAIVQMARLYAIAADVPALGTRERLTAAAGHGLLSERGAADLRDAFDFLSTIALRHQVTQLRRGDTPDYHIDPKDLSKLDREHLRDAFHIVKSIQNALATKFPIRTM
ncbi:histidine kinase [Corynebacterium sp. 13CS0277]|uniref:putative nucleotidyltransferase substrate binding domain-containing protein n=1 Tax=Corynebacterium sp. 13CS0277 TaxID=2071994 RepID=UPI000D02CC96|nr:putative nucleotidyltransferase substrate binding domain-containing protein [Corynebacterium sp. 13CS0277]PRQ11222.1 histidine kinase [Corynebacterium sp. 13CS0277]